MFSQEAARRITTSSRFDLMVTAVILINCFIIGLETYIQTDFTMVFQQTILVLFTFELLLRWRAKQSVQAFFSNGWIIMDLVIVIAGYIPESWFTDMSVIVTLRVLRVFRVLRLMSASEEIQLIISVLLRSLRSLSYNAVVFGICLYLFSVMGVTLFRLPTQAQASPEVAARLQELYAKAPHAPAVSPDPYGSLDEAMFTLFRVLTGEDWTDIRYNLVVASEMGLISSATWVVTLFHVFWYIISAFLLLNLLVGAILNNYGILMEESRQEKEVDKDEEMETY